MANPQMRIRSDVDLTPQTSIHVKQASRNTLEKPEEYFVEMTEYVKDNPNVTVAETDKAWELIDGVWVEGVTCFADMC